MGTGFFKGANNAKQADVSGTFFGKDRNEDGNYRVRVIRCVPKDTRDKGPMFFVEMEVLSGGSLPPGTRRSWGVKLMDKDGAFSKMRGFCVAALGLSETEDAEEVEALIKDFEAFLDDEVCANNCFKGVELNLEVSTRPQQKDPKKSFTHHLWSTAA